MLYEQVAENKENLTAFDALVILIRMHKLAALGATQFLAMSLISGNQFFHILFSPST